MRFLIAFAGIVVMAGTSAGQSGARLAARQATEGSLSPLDRTVTLALGPVSLKNALDEVARQAGVRIAYSRRVVPLERTVSVHLDAVPLRVALDTLLVGTGTAPALAPSGQILLTRESDGWDGRSRRQPGSIVGVVRDASTGTPLPRATVAVVGTRLAAETDAEGRYAIADVPAGTHRLRARMLGYAPVDTSVVVQDGQQATLDFALRASPIELDPVVSIGYATTRKRDLTGAVVSLSGDVVETQAAPTVTLSSGLQGRAAGVQVTSNSGLPGGGLRVRVRGNGSITANSEPLYVIDGVPAEQGSGSGDPQVNPLMSLDPNEIESLDVLKDASATAIYGARGANGVVLITTRRGQRGESRVTVQSSAGRQEISKTIPVLNAQEFMLMTNEARVNANRSIAFDSATIANARTYDYPAMMLRTGLQANQAITFSGGDQRLRYLLSGNYTDQEGIEIGSDFQRYGVRLNLDGDVSDRVRVGTSLSLTRVARNAPRVENGGLGNDANGIQAAMQFAPFAEPKDSTGKWIRTSPTTEPTPNPVANALELTDLNTTSRLLGSAYGELDITPALRVRSTFGGNFQFDKIHFFAPRTIVAGRTAGVGWINSSEERDLTNENTASYRGTLGPGSFDVLGGFSVQTSYDEDVTGGGEQFPTDATTLFDLGSASLLVPASSGVTESAILSYIGRANYGVAGKYLFTVTARYDGSSRFGANNKWAFFPSGAFAWRISDEGFMQSQSLFSDLKLRVSYGQVGNQAVQPYQSLSRLNVAWVALGGTEVPALAPSNTMPNPDLRWEQQTQFNAGVDATFFDDRVTLSLDAYRSVTKDLLLSVPVPRTTGFTSQLRNIGSVRNTGVELSLSTVNVRHDRFTWRSTLNIAGNRNRVTDLGTQTEIIISSRGGGFLGGSTHILRVGEPLGAIFGHEVLGLWQAGDTLRLPDPDGGGPLGEKTVCHSASSGTVLVSLAACVPGEYLIADVNGDSIINSSDRTILGYGDPKFYGGLGNHVAFGPFSLDVLMTFVYGNKIINGGDAYGSLGIMQANERKSVLDRWTPENTKTDVPRARQTRPRLLYSTFVEDGSYLRLQTLTLGYELPPRLIRGVEAARLFLTAQNLFVITGYSGFDPDVNSMGGDARFGGTDIGAYPRSRVWNVGLSVTF